jgi:uncharacterized OB-fold protein
MSAVASENPGSGTVYTETVVFSPPEAFASEVPYQLAIVELDTGRRLTARILGERAVIGDRVTFAEFRNDIAYFRKSSTS